VATDEGGDAVNHDLITALANLSDATHTAAAKAKAAGNVDLYNELRALGWSVASLISKAARGMDAEGRAS
jgi:hypothetical protein